jgi:serine/threonine-protein kinase HipA
MAFGFAKEFIKTNLQLSPLISPLLSEIIKATYLKSANTDSIDYDTSKGLPLFISDSLPDKFGTDLFAKFLEKEGKNYRDLTPLEKLTYIENSGMGALEFRHTKHGKDNTQKLDVKKLKELYPCLC